MQNKLKIILVALLISCSGFSQKLIFETTGFTVLEKNKKGEWKDWSDFTESKMIIKLDGDNHRVVVYSEVIQLFSIVKYNDPVSNETDNIVSLNCIDNEGVYCNVSVFTRKKQGNRMQLYITYDDLIIAYNIIMQKEDAPKEE
jgi:hypothetical protein